MPRKRRRRLIQGGAPLADSTVPIDRIRKTPTGAHAPRSGDAVGQSGRLVGVQELFGDRRRVRRFERKRRPETHYSIAEPQL